MTDVLIALSLGVLSAGSVYFVGLALGLYFRGNE